MTAILDRMPRASWDLVAAAQAGDTAAFGEIYRRYSPEVRAFLAGRAADRTLVEDLTSETFLRALLKVGTVQNVGKDVGAWLITIARNLLLDLLKSSRYRREVAWADDFDGVGRAPGADDAVLRGRVAQELARCLADLTAEQRECVVLRFWEGLSVQEVATRMCKQDASIRALQYRATRKLASLVPDWLR